MSTPHAQLCRCFWAPGFAGETSSAQPSLHALSAVAFDDALVSRVGFSLATGDHCPGQCGGSVFVDGAGPSSRRGFRFRTPAPHLHLYSNASRQGWGANLLDRLVFRV